MRIGRLVVECATADEALALIRQVDRDQQAPAPTAPTNSRPSGSRTTNRKPAEHGRLSEQYAKAVQALLSHPEGISGAQLSAAVGFEKITRLPGFMTAVRRELKKRGLPSDQVIVKKRSYEDGSWVSRFSVNQKYIDELRRLVA